MNRRLVIYRGLPGSGKTTRAADRSYILDAPMFEEDDFFTVPPHHGYMFDNAARQLALEYTLSRAAKALFDGEPEVIVTAVLPLKRDIEQYKRMLLNVFPDVELVVHTCKGKYNSVHNVPEDHMKMLRSVFEEEGYNT